MNSSTDIPLLEIYMPTKPFCSNVVQYGTVTADRPKSLGTLYNVPHNLGSSRWAALNYIATPLDIMQTIMLQNSS